MVFIFHPNSAFIYVSLIASCVVQLHYDAIIIISHAMRVATRPIIFSHPVVLELICVESTANRLKYEGYTTEYLKKIGRELL